ncbi:hypothetical protein [Geomonas azotofigens]|uniref:hypothetical protein n=1 Tax=Geomonas azotofigens TaxID=2843196 RepID=UPI001C100ABC|nr:hypothetical protein [Geomonas azotofigens]MBU5614928.1 hypothetical protein [Geomonas azotofigens]
MAYHRILRNYRSVGPTRFHFLNRRFRMSLSDTSRIPESFWAAHPKLREEYFGGSDKYDGIYHESMLGSKVVIAEREALQALLVEYLDEIVSLLEMAAVRTPEILIVSGFDLAKERRGRPRVKKAVAAHDEQGDGNSIPV